MSTYDVTYRDHYRKKKLESNTKRTTITRAVQRGQTEGNDRQAVRQRLTAAAHRLCLFPPLFRRLTMGMSRRAEWAAGHASAVSGAAAAAASSPSSLAPPAASAATAALSSRRIAGHHASGSSGGYLCGSSGSTPRFACSAVGWDSSGLPLVNNPSGPLRGTECERGEVMEDIAVAIQNGLSRENLPRGQGRLQFSNSHPTAAFSDRDAVCLSSLTRPPIHLCIRVR